MSEPYITCGIDAKGLFVVVSGIRFRPEEPEAKADKPPPKQRCVQCRRELNGMAHATVKGLTYCGACYVALKADWTEEKLAAYRGPCAVCGKPVFHAFPWWDKNPLKYPDARPYHEDCWTASQCQ